MQEIAPDPLGQATGGGRRHLACSWAARATPGSARRRP